MSCYLISQKSVNCLTLFKYIRKTKFENSAYILDKRAYDYYLAHTDLDLDKLTYMDNNKIVVSKSYIESYYKLQMDTLRSYIQFHETELLIALNDIIFSAEWKKYKAETIAEGEMQSMRVYIHDNPIYNISLPYNITPLDEIEEEKTVGTFYINGAIIPKYQIYHLVGVVIAKDKLHNSITLLTTSGPVDVKIWKDSFSFYDRVLVEFVNNEKVLKQDSFFATGTFVHGYWNIKRRNFLP